VAGFIAELLALTDRTDAADVHEVGCGEGELARRLAARGMRVLGTDASPAVVAEARRRAKAEGLDIEFRAAPLEDLDATRDAAELVVCCEVLEHLPDPQAGLSMVARLATPWAIVSVPREPLWRLCNLARLRYVRDLGNTPGHLNHWSRRAFIEFVRRRLEVIEVRHPPPWTMALCRARPPRVVSRHFARSLRASGRG
jgi:ubiquinone/menaquinone biosynthesis C-methylase UbiE